MKLHASYWKYEGNHSAGHDCERYDPHCLGINMISFLVYLKNSGTYYDPLTANDLDKVTVVHSKGDNFGHEVKVSAPSEVWDRAKDCWKTLYPD